MKLYVFGMNEIKKKTNIKKNQQQRRRAKNEERRAEKEERRAKKEEGGRKKSEERAKNLNHLLGVGAFARVDGLALDVEKLLRQHGKVPLV